MKRKSNTLNVMSFCHSKSCPQEVYILSAVLIHEMVITTPTQRCRKPNRSEKELAKVTMKREDFELIMTEIDISLNNPRKPSWRNNGQCSRVSCLTKWFVLSQTYTLEYLILIKNYFLQLKTIIIKNDIYYYAEWL